MLRRTARFAKHVVKTAIDYGTDQERIDARARVWNELDVSVKDTKQWLGKMSAGCFATHQVYEACDFACTACYLTKESDDTPPLPFEDVKKQLDEIREYAGPGSNVQITAGEVTLLPEDDLIKIVKYACKEVKLDAMLMTHGQTFYKNPKYLERLITEGGLEKLAVHIDTTQRGRIGMSKHDSEADLNWIRDHFANLIRDMRKKTGVDINASHTFTVTEKNLPQLPDVMRWMKDNNDAFRMISFQPTAAVGRTREKEQVQQQDTVWGKIGEGLGLDNICQSTFYMGHPKCNNTSLMFVIKFGDETKIMQVTRPGEAIDEWFWDELMSGKFKHYYSDGADNAELAGRAIGMVAKSPKYLWQIPYFFFSRVWGEKEWMPRFMKAVATNKPWSIKPLVVVVHNFMSSHELETEEGKLRLENCAFRLPVDGEMVPMCTMNGTDLRKDKNLETQERLVGIENWKPKREKKKKKAPAA